MIECGNNLKYVKKFKVYTSTTDLQCSQDMHILYYQEMPMKKNY